MADHPALSGSGADPVGVWIAVDRFAEARLTPGDRVLDAVLARSGAAGLPGINVTASQGQLLQLLVRMAGVRRILEIGTLGAYSTIWMARGLPPDGRLVTIEIDPAAAAIARANLAAAGLMSIVDLRVGPALEELPKVEAERLGPFDLIFVDADKASTPQYLDWALRLSRAGSLIFIDNVVRGGALADEHTDDPRVAAMQRVVGLVGDNPRLTATLLQTVGAKGYDGFMLALVGEELPAGA